MESLELGQKIDIDVAGLGLPGARIMEARATGTVVDIAPGAITVRLDVDGGERVVTVSPRRIQIQ
jgi:ribosomal protein L21E